jgi:hypothetical protein
MTCRDFERAWNELLDADGACSGRAAASACEPSPAMAERVRALVDHAADCPACSQVGARYQALWRAIRVWGPAPAPPAGLADRILAEVQTPTPSAWPVYGAVRRRPLWPIAAAVAAITATAAAIAIALPLLNRAMERTLPNSPAVVLHTTPVEPGRDEGAGTETVAVDARALNLALADATAATWDLARSASEPAARISRQVLDAATNPENDRARPASSPGLEPVAATVAVPSLEALAPDPATAGAMLQQVGDRLATGVRPLSDSARNAFGFLLGPALAKPEVPANPPAQKGA